MSLHYIIDGYDLIKHKSFGRFKRSHDERLALLSLIRSQRLAGSAKNAVTVVFDGYAGGGMGAGEHLGCSVVFSCEETADERIRKILEHADGATTVVVSDDRQVKFFAKSFRAQVVGVDDFLAGRKTEHGHGISGDKDSSGARRRDASKPELTYTKMVSINKELSDLWLKKK